MTKITRILLFATSILFILSINTDTHNNIRIKTYKYKGITSIATKTMMVESIYLKYKRYEKDLILRESGNNHKVVNQIGCIGKYQLCPVTIKAFKRHIKKHYNTKIKISKKDVIKDTLLQKAIFYWHNYRIIHKLIKNTRSYKDTKIIVKGFYGYMGVGHLCGIGGMISYIRYGKNPRDINGTSCFDYFRLFDRSASIDNWDEITLLYHWLNVVVNNIVINHIIPQYKISKHKTHTKHTQNRHGFIMGSVMHMR